MSAFQNERQRRGALGEKLAARFLELEGLRVLSGRLRVADVEIDLLVRDASALVVVEVKLRTSAALPALDALRVRQIARLQRTATPLLRRHPWAETVRIDAVMIDWQMRSGCVEIRHLRGIQAR